MKKDELFMACAIIIVILLFGYANVDHARPLAIDKTSARFLRGILDQYFTRIAGFSIPTLVEEKEKF